MGRYVSIRGSGSWAQIPTRPLFLSLLLASAALLGAAALQPWMPINEVLRAPLPAAQHGPACCSLFAGALAKLGSMLCIATASVCLFTALLVHGAGAGRSRALFFVAGGLLSIALGVGAFFRFSAGSPAVVANVQAISAAVLGAGLLVYLVASWRLALSARAPLLVTAGIALAMSVSIPIAAADQTPFWMLVEDALKFVGVTFWTGFHVVAAAQSGEEIATGRVTTVMLSPERLSRRAA